MKTASTMRALWTALFFCLAFRSSFADETASRDEGHAITVHDCRMEFVERSVLSVERLGAIEFVVEEGHTVNAGDVIIQLHDEVARAALALAEHQAHGEITVEVARKAAEATRYEYDIAVEANANALEGRTPPVPEAELTRLRLAAEQAELEVAVAEHEVETYRLSRDQAQAELNTYRVLSPGDGSVTQVYHRRGETVQQGEPIVEIVQTGMIRVEGRIALADAPFVTAGDRVLLTIAASDEDQPDPIEGVLGFVDVSAIQSLQEVRVWADFTNTGTWRAGIPCEMQIIAPASSSTATE